MMVRNIGFGVWLYEETGFGLQLGLIGIVQLAVQMPAILFWGIIRRLDRQKKIDRSDTVFSFIYYDRHSFTYY
ncbi:MAG: hypothetical protein CM1200mP3_13300 [Chloroflexota bacterium]|nr:MAG: hypothetical protein CM1200mP3_13300 [Chloroflexota bacterium]